MKNFLLLILLTMFAACGSVPQDHTMPPIDGNLYTLELASCGKRDVGLLGCAIEANGSLELIAIHKGEYQIKSNRCNFFENKKYSEDGKIAFSYEKLTANKPASEKNCLYDVMLFVDGLDKGFRGQFLLVEKEFKFANFEFLNQKFNGIGQIQIKEGSEMLQSLKFEAATPGTIFWEGCKKSGEKNYKSNPEIAFKEIISDYLTEGSTCILTIGLMPNDLDKEVEYAKFHISVFDKSIVSLAEPQVSEKQRFGKWYATVRADALVAAIAVGDNWKITKGTKEKKFTSRIQSDEYYVRVATANGRYMLLKVKDGGIVWKNYIHY